MRWYKNNFEITQIEGGSKMVMVILRWE